MPDPSAIQSDGINASLYSAPKIKRRLQPPSDPILKATKTATIYPDDGSEPALSCQTCNKILPHNPRLCDDCQIWNDAHHVFNCLSTAKLDKDLDRRHPITLGQMLAQIRNYGPLCLSKSQYGVLNPALPIFSNTSMPLYLIEPNDLRFTGLHRLPRSGEERLAPIRTVIYIVMTAPLGSNLRNQFPHLDEYKMSDEAKKLWSDDKHLGARRDPRLGKPDALLQPTFGLQVDLTYEAGTTGLVAVVCWDNTYIHTAQFLGLLSLCEDTHKDESKLGSIARRKSSLDLTMNYFRLGSEQPTHTITNSLSFRTMKSSPSQLE